MDGDYDVEGFCAGGTDENMDEEFNVKFFDLRLLLSLLLLLIYDYDSYDYYAYDYDYDYGY